MFDPRFLGFLGVVGFLLGIVLPFVCSILFGICALALLRTCKTGTYPDNDLLKLNAGCCFFYAFGLLFCSLAELASTLHWVSTAIPTGAYFVVFVLALLSAIVFRTRLLPCTEIIRLTVAVLKHS